MDIRQAKAARSSAQRCARDRAEKSAALRRLPAVVRLVDLDPGDEVTLRHVGRSGVPKSLHQTRARIVEIGARYCIVHSFDEQAAGIDRPRRLHEAEIAEIVVRAERGRGRKAKMVECDHCDGTGKMQARCSGCGKALTDANAADDDTCRKCAAEDDHG